ncbi:hypothetical protein C7M84_018833 [Penaeus vannamei]|uniref:Uncharacterized protein n=1 Tax=Penaeus vannamei TaxID=6689 RepID=A0A3R7LUF6_PENVA|nr:hypothetical protein C7M84_018833 [Penaeus vannamei]
MSERAVRNSNTATLLAISYPGLAWQLADHWLAPPPRAQTAALPTCLISPPLYERRPISKQKHANKLNKTPQMRQTSPRHETGNNSTKGRKRENESRNSPASTLASPIPGRGASDVTATRQRPADSLAEARAVALKGVLLGACLATGPPLPNLVHSEPFRYLVIAVQTRRHPLEDKAKPPYANDTHKDRFKRSNTKRVLPRIARPYRATPRLSLTTPHIFRLPEMAETPQAYGRGQFPLASQTPGLVRAAQASERTQQGASEARDAPRLALVPLAPAQSRRPHRATDPGPSCDGDLCEVHTPAPPPPPPVGVRLASPLLPDGVPERRPLLELGEGRHRGAYWNPRLRNQPRCFGLNYPPAFSAAPTPPSPLPHPAHHARP